MVHATLWPALGITIALIGCSIFWFLNNGSTQRLFIYNSFTQNWKLEYWKYIWTENSYNKMLLVMSSYLREISSRTNRSHFAFNRRPVMMILASIGIISVICATESAGIEPLSKTEKLFCDWRRHLQTWIEFWPDLLEDSPCCLSPASIWSLFLPF